VTLRVHEDLPEARAAHFDRALRGSRRRVHMRARRRARDGGDGQRGDRHRRGAGQKGGESPSTHAGSLGLGESSQPGSRPQVNGRGSSRRSHRPREDSLRWYGRRVGTAPLLQLWYGHVCTRRSAALRPPWRATPIALRSLGSVCERGHDALGGTPRKRRAPGVDPGALAGPVALHRGGRSGEGRRPRRWMLAHEPAVVVGPRMTLRAAA
jgi:hypothetical protein